MKKLNVIWLMVLAFTMQAQESGDALREQGKLEAAYMNFGARFMQNPNDSEAAYKLAATLSLANQVDTAFYFLNVALHENASLMPLANSDFFNLIEDQRWEQIEQNQFRKFQQQEGALKKVGYARRLIRMIVKDQAFDYHMDMGKKFYAENGRAPHWFFPITQRKGQLNRENFTEMQQLIEEFGWPKYSDVGELAADAPLLIINHHPSEEVRMKYLDQIRESCKQGEGSCMEYAKIHDRILVNTDRPQTYGMQFRFNASGKLEPFPIEEPELVNKRRAKIGLEPLEVYLKRKINYDWKVPQKK